MEGNGGGAEFEAKKPRWQGINQMQLMAMPDLPFKVDKDQHGNLLVTERNIQGVLPTRITRPLYEPQIPTPQQLAKLNGVAVQFGFKDFSELCESASPAEEVLQDPTVPPYLKRYIRAEDSSDFMILRGLRQAALEQAYYDKAMSLGRKKIAEVMPDFLPQEATTGITTGYDGRTHINYGKFGTKHLIVLNSPTEVSSRAINNMTDDSEIVISAVHELLHQDHEEKQGIWNYPADEGQDLSDDPLEFYNQAMSIIEKKSIQKKSPSATDNLQIAISEAFAYLGDEHAKKTHFGSIYPCKDFYVDFVETYLQNVSLEDRLSVLRQLEAIDLSRLPELGDAEIEQIFTNPLSALDLPKKEQPHTEV